MKDPFVEEIRGYRMEHAKRFDFDIHAICNDLRKLEKNIDKEIKNNFNKVTSLNHFSLSKNND